MDTSTPTPTAETSTIFTPLLAVDPIATSISDAVAAAGADAHIVNSTDATRGEPILVRAMKRKAELEAALTMVPAEDARARADIEHVLGSFESLLTGDLTALSSLTAADLSRLLEINKHLAETTPGPDALPVPELVVLVAIDDSIDPVS
jgi:hypothetical protein